jgi:hypothetical protein
MTPRIAARLEMLPKLTVGDLNAEWRRIWGSEAPLGTPDHLMRGIAWKLQGDGFDEMTQQVERRLDELASYQHPVGALLERSSKPKPGTHLMRTYRGESLVVVVTDVGFFFDGKTYRSLTAVASTITGSNTPGPAFFGLNRAGDGAEPHD